MIRWQITFSSGIKLLIISPDGMRPDLLSVSTYLKAWVIWSIALRMEAIKEKFRAGIPVLRLHNFSGLSPPLGPFHSGLSYLGPTLPFYILLGRGDLREAKG